LENSSLKSSYLCVPFIFMNEEKWMKAALKEAKKAESEDEVPIGAVIVFNNKIIARAHNRKESSKKATAHAEILAIEKANKNVGDWRLSECELYVTVEPCVMCVGAIIQARLKRLVYGAADPKFGAVESVIRTFQQSGWNHYPEISSGVLQEESSQIIKSYFTKKRDK